MSVLDRATVFIEGDTTNLNSALAKARGEMQRTGADFQKLGRDLSLKVTLPLAAAAGFAVKAFSNQQEAVAKMQTVLRTTGGVANVTSKELQDLASSLQKVTTVGDETIIAGQAILLTFKNVRNEMGKGNDIFNRTLKLGLDVSALLGQDLQQGMIQFGKAIDNPLIGLLALRRIGVSFSEAEVKQIQILTKHNKLLEAQALILNAVEGQIGPLSEAMAKTPLGQWKQAWNAIDDAMERVGEIIATVLVPVFQSLRSGAEQFQTWPKWIKEVIVILGALVASFPPLLIMLGLVQKAMAVLTVAAAGLSISVGALLGWIALAIAAFVALAVAAKLIIDNWNWIKLQTVKIWGAIVSFLLTAFKPVVIVVIAAGRLIAASWEWVKAQAMRIWGAITVFVSSVWQKILPTLLKVSDAVVQSWLFIRAQAARLWGAITKIIHGAAAAAFDMLASIPKIGPAFVAAAAEANKFLKEFEAENKATVDRLTKEWESLGKKTAEAVAPVTTPRPPPAATFTLTEDAQTAVDDFSKAIRSATALSSLLGKEFDLTGAKADAYRALIEALTKEGIALDQTIPGLGKSLRTLAKEYNGLVVAAKKAAEAEEVLNNLLAAQRELRIGRAGGGNLTAGMGGTDTGLPIPGGALIFGATAEQIGESHDKVREAGRTTAELYEQTWKNALENVQRSFADAFQNIIKGGFKLMDILHNIADAITSAFVNFLAQIAVSSLGRSLKIPGFAHGGFLDQGALALVGEEGPELVRAGRGGLTISPLSGFGGRMGAGGGQAPIPVVIQVTAVDRKGVAEFFEENQDLLAKGIFKAQQRSSLLRRLPPRR